MIAVVLHPEVIVIGALSGFTYAALAAGLVLIYRATRVINFAHAQIGSFCAAIQAQLVIGLNWNFFVALPISILAGALIGAVVELTIMRRLFNAPRLMLLVATIGIAQVMLLAEYLLPANIGSGARYPTPVTTHWKLGSVFLLGEHLMVLAFVPPIVIGVGLFLTRTRYGLAIRAAADNADAAWLSGISVKKVSTIVWVLSGALAAVTVILINPVRGAIPGYVTEAGSPGLLLRALAAALVGRMTSLPLALAGGVGVGIVEAILIANNSGDPGTADALLFVAVLVLVFVRGSSRTPGADSTTLGLTPRSKPLSEQALRLPWARRLPAIATAAAFAAAISLPLVFSGASQLFLLSRMPIYAIIAVSTTILVGWAGQLSLGQFAFVGFGAMCTASFTGRGMPFGAAVLLATVGGTAMAVAVGYPALRVRGLFLAVTTLGFAVASSTWLLAQEFFIPRGQRAFVSRPKFLGVDFASQRAYYYLCLFTLAVVILLARRLRSTGIGRIILAVRDNDLSAAAYTIMPARGKLIAFGLSGGVAALAGGLLAGLRPQFDASIFPPSASLAIVAMTIIGGLGSVTGSVLGAVYVVGVPTIFGNEPSVQAATSGIGLLLLLLYLPGGLVSVIHRAGDLAVGFLVQRAERSSASFDAVTAGPSEGARQPRTLVVARTRPMAGLPGGEHAELDEHLPLEAFKIAVRFGGVTAVDHVTLEVRPREMVGLIGANGAGKSTLLNAVSGFVPAEGAVRVFGQDVSDLKAYDRARAGIGRVFQDARLFGELTITETVQVALEARETSELVPSLLGFPPSRRAERYKTEMAAEIIGFLGLGRYARTFIGDLSTGTRRIVELACLLALQPRILLLDEPTAGVAQREAEAFGPLIKRVQTELGASAIIIEHDMPLVMEISDRIYAMETGQVIAEGTPSDVRHDPAVIASYLGTDERAIAHSGPTR